MRRLSPRYDLFIVLAWALALRLIFLLLTADTYDPDEFVYLALGRDMSNTVVPYRDFLFFHPPGMLVLVHLLQPLLSWWWPSARVLELLVDTVTAALVWRIGVLIHGRRGGLAAGLIYGASPLALVCAVRVDQDPLITALGIGGLLVLLSRRSWLGVILAGVCLGLAVWIKYPAILFLPIYLLAAPRRGTLTLGVAGVVAALAFAPFLHDAPALFDQTVLWQAAARHPSDLLTRLGSVGAFWLLLNPLAVLALIRRGHPRWVVAGFCLGGVFLFTSQVYYHYFVPALPFAALLAAPLVAGPLRRFRYRMLAGAVALTALWGADIAHGSDPGRLFISASRLSALRPTIKVLDRSTRKHQMILTDQFEYAYLANRPTLDDYFWNAHGLVNAHFLEYRLDHTGAIVLTRHVAPTYPLGFTTYLEDSRYRRVQTGATEIWLTPAGAPPTLSDLPLTNWLTPSTMATR